MRQKASAGASSLSAMQTIPSSGAKAEDTQCFGSLYYYTVDQDFFVSALFQCLFQCE